MADSGGECLVEEILYRSGQSLTVPFSCLAAIVHQQVINSLREPRFSQS
jgi:hypothetical protein